MTKREMMMEVIASETMSAEAKEIAQAEIVRMDEANTKRKEKTTAKQKENEGLKSQIVAIVGEEKMIASEVAQAIGVSTQKASALCRQLVEDGTFVATEKKVTGKGNVKEYAKAQYKKGRKPFSFWVQKNICSPPKVRIF